MTPDAYKLAQEHGGVWGSHPDFPVEDWQREVLQGEATLGYWDLTLNRLLEYGIEERELESTERLEESERKLSQRFGGRWGEHPHYPREEWSYEVGNDDTRKGYWEWVEDMIEQDPRGKDWRPGMGASLEMWKEDIDACLERVWEIAERPTKRYLKSFLHELEARLNEFGVTVGAIEFTTIGSYEDKGKGKGWTASIKQGRSFLGRIIIGVMVWKDVHSVDIRMDLRPSANPQDAYFLFDSYSIDCDASRNQIRLMVGMKDIPSMKNMAEEVVNALGLGPKDWFPAT